MHAPRHSERPRRGRIPRLTGESLAARPEIPERLRRRFLFLFAALAAILACRAESRAVRSGTSRVPRRVVSLAPNLTEIVFALGAGGSLVGVSEYSDYPPAARAIPRVGGLEVSAEKVASLRPDLVLATREGNARGPVTALAAAGLPVLVLPTGSLDAVLESIRRGGEALGRREQADRLADSLSRRRAAVRERVAGKRRPKTLLLVWPEPPQAAGGGTFLDEVLSDAGADNLMKARPGWPVISAEYLATAPVEALVLPVSPATRPAFERALLAGPLSRGSIRQARLLWIDDAVLTRPGPRVFGALDELASALHRADVAGTP